MKNRNQQNLKVELSNLQICANIYALVGTAARAERRSVSRAERSESRAERDARRNTKCTKWDEEAGEKHLLI